MMVYSDNLHRLIKLANDVFAVKNDPQQLDVNEEVIKRLRQIHPATVSEYTDENGPAAWVLVIPTTGDLMHRFLEGSISEKELFDLTAPGLQYDCIYLCSALVLEEYRRKGIAGNLAREAISEICKDHPVRSLFVWPFTAEGDIASEAIARAVGLPVYRRMKA